MKKILLYCLFLASFTAKAQFIKAELQAAGLTCSMCSYATEKQLKTVDFLDSIQVDLEHTTYILYFKQNAVVNPDVLKKKVEDAGFSIASLKLTYHFNNVPIPKDNHISDQGNLYHIINSNNQTLQGDVHFKVIDKGFVTEKEHKKYRKQLKSTPCYETGKMPDVNRVYHLILL